MSFLRFPSACVLSAGGGYWRLWKKNVGLLAEVPTSVVLDRSTEEIHFLGQEASAVEGKLDNRFLHVRPFFSDQIVDRALLRELLQHVFRVAREHGLSWQDWVGMRFVLAPTVRPLHEQWLLRTAREAGMWFVQPVDEFSALRSLPLVAKQPLFLVLDCGFSSLRVALYSRGILLRAFSEPEWGIHALCDRLAALEKHKSGRIFSAHDFFDLQWSVEHTAFDEREQKAVSVVPGAKNVDHVSRDFLRGGELLVENALRDLEPELRAQFQRSPIIVVGGGAEMFTRLATLHRSALAFTRAKNLPYTCLQAAGEQ